MRLPFHFGLRFIRGVPAPDCQRVVGAIGRRLEEANRNAERDFLHVGERLADLNQAVRNIAQEAGSIAGIVSDDQMAGASRTLETLLADAGTARSSTVSAGLHEVLSATESVQGSLRQIRTMARTFGVLGVLTQIESARLVQAGDGFSDLAAEVERLGAGIGRQTEEILSVAEETRDRVKRILGQVRAAEDTVATRLAAIVSVVTSGILRMREERDRASGASQRLAQEYRETSRRMGDLVASLQCQDSTRQKTEHVRQALARAIEDDGEGKATRRLGAVAEILRAQLHATAESYRAATTQIRESLDAIARQASIMAGQAQSLLGVEVEQKDSFFTAMETNLGEILRVLDECNAAERDRGGRLASLQQVIARMSGLTEAIQTVTIQMQRIALNAAIRAIHTGEPGAPLAAVAGAIQKLAADSAEIAGEVARTLDGLPEAVEKLTARPSSGGDPDRPVQIGDVVETLHSLQEMTFARVQYVGSMSEQVSADMKEACLQFGDQREFLEILDACTRQLGEIAEQWPARGDLGGDAVLESLRSKYTMEAERRVHDGITGSEGTLALATQATAAEFGDNVELF